MRWGVEPKIAPTKDGDKADKAPTGLSSAPWDDEFEEAGNGAATMPDADRASLRRYYEDHPERWARLSPAGKAVLGRAIGAECR